jgi:hypothetical protein
MTSQTPRHMDTYTRTGHENADAKAIAALFPRCYVCGAALGLSEYFGRTDERDGVVFGRLCESCAAGCEEED